MNDLLVIAANAVAKAPDLESAYICNDFLCGITNTENDLFIRAVDEFGVTREDYDSIGATPTIQGVGDFIARTAMEGVFDDVALVPYVTEGTYLDLGTRLLSRGAKLSSAPYLAWIRLHSPYVLDDLVGLKII